MGFEQPQIGRHRIACFQQHYVARHQFGSRHVEGLPVAQHQRLYFTHLFESIHGFTGAVLLHEADEGVEDDDNDNDDCVNPLPQHT